LINALACCQESKACTPSQDEFLVDVERNRKSEISAETIRGVCKSLAPFCHCFIVLEEANGIVEFGNDVYREKFIYIDKLSTEEAKEFLKKKKSTLTDEQMKYIFDNIGTNAQGLLEILTKVPETYSLEEFVSKKLDKATKDLLAFPLQTILKALKEHPEGVNPEYFNKQEEEGVDLSAPRQVGVVMKKGSNPIIYREDTGKYHLLSTAHKTALKSYNPMIKKLSLNF